MAIIKILSRHSPSFSSLAKYVLRYVLDDTKNKQQEVFTQNLRSNDVQGFVSEFIFNEQFRKQRRSDSIILYHEIVSFSASENNAVFTAEVIADLAYEYMRLRGETGVILGSSHHNVDHVHLHFCVSALEYRSGKSFGLSKTKLQELKIAFQQYHNLHFPAIELSSPNHGSKERYKSHGQWHREQREQISDTVEYCYGRATSQQHFLKLLQGEGLHHYERGGTPTGIIYNDTKFRFSRVLNEGKQFDSLPIDRTEEEQALQEIRAVRERQQVKDRENRDFEDKAR